tara:strand:- start:1748 stop:4498 length:2751 start_codon:yes stop_codon:yes gene_type:complete
MSNVAIKLIAVTGVVGLGVLMFLQAQKGIQSGSIENQIGQLDVLDAAGATVLNESEPEDDLNAIPLSQVPAELSELAARNATPLKKQAETPFSPNTKTASPKIKLTAATEEATTGDLEVSADFEPVEKSSLDPSPQGLDFRAAPEMKTLSPTENPFADSVKAPLTDNPKLESPALAQPEFTTGPQFGAPAPANSTPLTGDTKTTVPARENIAKEMASRNPFDKPETAPAQPANSPEPEQPELRDALPKAPLDLFPEEKSPAQKLDSVDTPFELQEESVPSPPAVKSNPFMTVPTENSSAKTLSAPTTKTPVPNPEPEFNPFGNEPLLKSKEPVTEVKPAAAKSLPAIPEIEENTSAAFPEEPEKPIVQSSPAKQEMKPDRQPFSPDESSDVVVIKKRNPEVSPQEPPLFTIEGETGGADKSSPQPIEISPTPEPRPLSLVEGNQPAIEEPVKQSVQQKIQSPQMTIQKMAPPEAVLGQPFIYQVLVKNTGTTSAQEVVVEDRIPQGAKLTGTIPRAEQINDRIIWRLGAMGPGVEKKISIRVIPEEAGQIGSVATVNFVTEVTSETKITSPQLTIKTDQPEAVKPGELTVVNYTITNSGTGDAKNVFLRSIIPPQFSHPGGDDLEYEIGIIPAGATKEVQLKLKAIKPGSGKNISSVMGDGNLKVATEIPLKVIGNSEQFLLTRKGPKNRYLGHSGTYENVITNNSEKAVEKISVFESIPPGMKFVTASASGQFDPVRKVVQWDIPELAAGDSKVLTIELEPTDIGKMISTVQVVTDNNTKDSANLQSETTVIGQALLKMETSELKGPLEVGDKMTMQVQLINQGSASANNVEFRVKIPPELVFLSAKGPARYQQAGAFVIFESTQELAAKQALNFELSLSARNKGDARVLVQVQSKQMEKPLSREEAIPVLEKLQ